MSEQCDYDLLIIGGGMVGASLACAVSGKGLRIGLVEAVPYSSDKQPSYDARAIALSYGTQRILKALGVWKALAFEACPIKQIHVSDRGHFGASRLYAEKEGVPALGYVAEARDIGHALMFKVSQLDDVELICPAQLKQLDFQEDHCKARLNINGEEKSVTCKLLVAADGGKSAIREQLHLTTRESQYHQTAIITTVSTSKPHNHVAYERFTEQGPLAFLPLTEGRCSVVWTQPDDQVDEIMSLQDEPFTQQLQQRFGHRLGRITRVGKRHAYPLKLLHTTEQIRPRLAVIGNAAHTLHPIAGQGFNLGLRDVATLAQVIVDGHQEKQDIGEFALLQRYSQWREKDQHNTIIFTDNITRLFSNDSAPLGIARSLGLLALDLSPPLKHTLGKLAMGQAGKQPKLSRGLAL